MAQGGLQGVSERERVRDARRAAWSGHVAAWRSSGLSQSEYCRRHGLKPPDFSWWKRALQQPQRPPLSALEFIPLKVIASSEAGSGCEIVLRNGRRLRVGGERDLSFIGKLAAVLEAASPVQPPAGGRSC